MQTLDEQPETIHLYVVREEIPKPSFAPIILSVIALLLLVAVSVAFPYQQPVTRAVIRVPAVPLPLKTFTANVTFIPTGVKVYPVTTAHGILTITNGSIIGQSIPAGFTIQGVTTDYAIYVPGGNANGYGWAQVRAHAVVNGHGGNLSPYAINSVIGSSVYIRNLSAFSGGRDSYSVKVITAQDRSVAILKAKNMLLNMSLGLHYPCSENHFREVVKMVLTWRCQFVEIIPPELFARNQERLSFNRAEASRQCKEPERFLLRAGYIKCDICKNTMFVNASKSRHAPIYFCSDSGHSNTVNAGQTDAIVWDYMIQLADEIELIERAIHLTINSASAQHDIAAIDNSITNSQAKIEQYTADLANLALKGAARDVILGLLSDEYLKLQTKQEEKSLVEAGIVDAQHLAVEAEKILAWCKTVKEARAELSYQQKRDFLRILGIRMFIGKSDKRSEELLWHIEASLPEVQELIMSNTYKNSSADSVTHISTCYP